MKWILKQIDDKLGDGDKNEIPAVARFVVPVVSVLGADLKFSL